VFFIFYVFIYNTQIFLFLRENDFDIAMIILSDWRLDRYYWGRAKLFDFSRSMPMAQDEMKLKA
jgi:hypothetical protein